MALSNKEIGAFQNCVFEYYHTHGRHDLPWRINGDPYRILVSEIMLQQTQVERVIPKFEVFLRAFPSAGHLASASVQDVLTYWQGLGYNRRGLYLQRAAQVITNDFQGKFPQTDAELQTLPGVGQYTARAILAFAFNQPVVMIETNIRRVYLHHFFANEENVTDRVIFEYIAQTVDKSNPRQWYWALMDYGSHLPKVTKQNANRKSAHYTKQGKFHGSDREIRGHMVRLFLAGEQITPSELSHTFQTDEGRILAIRDKLQSEGFLS